MMVGILDFCSIWLMGGPKVVQRTPTGLTTLLPTRPADSERHVTLGVGFPESKSDTLLSELVFQNPTPRVE